MKKCLIICCCFFSLCGFMFSAEKAPTKKQALLTADTVSGLELRLIGPALMSGRISDFAVNPNDHHQYYVAISSGGVWKTVNAGTTYEPVFDGEGSYSIGCVALDPNNPHIVWVGTGENNNQRSVAYGDGVYRSLDDGKSWQNMGLKESEHIAKILIDPRNSNVVYVAAYGPLWRSGGDRGVFKSTDGGKSWKAVLTISPDTGVGDLAMDPHHPDTLYAAAHQRRRHVHSYIGGGPESALYKSDDCGTSWSKLSSGLPSVELGRIGLAVSPVNPDVVYAIVEAADKKGGFFRSLDRGASFAKMSNFVTAGNYYQEIFCDPKETDRVYAMDVYLKVSDDGGKTFHNLGEKSKHVDNHVIWIDPNNTNHYLVGCDGGIYESFDRAANWNFKANLPVSQFYKVATDNSRPFYYVYGGTQDNNSQGGPSRTTNSAGIVNSDWFNTCTGDGFESQIDPQNPNIVYAQSQYGGLVRYDRQSGEILGIKPQEGKGEAALRWNWDAPLLLSPHSATRIYFAANRLFRSDDRGATWRPISPDLTRALDRHQFAIMGRVWSVDTLGRNDSTSQYGNIVALEESPLKEGWLYAGTDDGLIQISEDGGKNWRRSATFPGVPELTYVNALTASLHRAGTIYCAFNNHKNGDFKPYLLKSSDNGRTWQSIAGNLPARGSVYSVAEDHVLPSLLFAGTEFGLFFTVDSGQNWMQLKSGLPVIAVHDIAIQRRENDLVLATFGRGFYILDDYSPLRQLTAETLSKPAQIFPIKDALMYIESRPLGLRGKSYQGEAYYTAANPPFGAAITYYLKESIKTRKEKRQEAEKELIKNGKPVPFPSWEALRAEDNEEPASLIFSISDAAGKTVCRLKAPAKAGVHRIFWDLRYPPTDPASLEPPDNDPWNEPPAGVRIVPGKYAVSLAQSVDGAVSELLAPVPFQAVPLGNVTLPAEDRQALQEFQKEVAEVNRIIAGSVKTLSDLEERLPYIDKALENTPQAPAKLFEAASELRAHVRELDRQFNGEATKYRRNVATPPTVVDRMYGIISDQWQSSAAPTQTDRDALRLVKEEFTPLQQRLKQILAKELKELEKAMEEAGAPYTPGRSPDRTE